MTTSADPLGIVAEQQAKREAAVRGLSPMAKHQRFPQIYAKPLPVPTSAEMLRRQLQDLTKVNADLRKANADLRAMVAALQAQLESAITAEAEKLIKRRHSPADVINVFLMFYNRGRVVQWTIDHLRSPRRARDHTIPRHVCIWLVKKLCSHYSLPQIGRLFGNRDHTTAMHAIARAPFWLLIEPALKEAADATLARFGALDETKGEQA